MPNIRATTPVPPELGRAAIWQDTLSDANGEYTLDEWIDFLYAREGKGPAICMSSEDFQKQKTALEQACVKIKCTYEQKKIIDGITGRVDALKAKAESASKKK